MKRCKNCFDYIQGNAKDYKVTYGQLATEDDGDYEIVMREAARAGYKAEQKFNKIRR
jgi:hypothetical protein